MAMTPGPQRPDPERHLPSTPPPPVNDRGRLGPAAYDDARLGCGREIDELWRTLGRPAKSHERSCPSCTEARAAMAPLAEATARMRAEETSEPELEPDPQVLTRVMAVGQQTRPARVAVSLQISIALRSAIPEIARQVRERVRSAIAAEVGVRPVIVDINVQGVHDA